MHLIAGLPTNIKMEEEEEEEENICGTRQVEMREMSVNDKLLLLYILYISGTCPNLGVRKH